MRAWVRRRVVSEMAIDRVILASEQLRLIADTLDGQVLVQMCDEMHETGGRCALAPDHVGKHVTRDGRHYWLEH